MENFKKGVFQRVIEKTQHRIRVSSVGARRLKNRQKRRKWERLWRSHHGISKHTAVKKGYIDGWLND